MASELYSGTEAVGGTEWSCTTDSSGPDVDTTDGCFQLFIDLSDMTAADILRVRCYEKVRSSGTQRIVWEKIFRDAQAEPNYVSEALILLHGWDFTLYAVAGTITVEWSIRSAV